jgi:hypothetical protein
MKANSLAALFASLLLSGACAADLGSDSGSGVDDSKTVDQISAQEATAVCEYGSSAISDADYKKGLCTFSGFDRGGNPEGCQAVFEECMAAPLEGPDAKNDCSEAATVVGNLPACASQITIAEMQDCLHAEYAQMAAEISGVTCMTPIEDIPEYVRPVECRTLDEQCPELFETAIF